MWRLKIKTYHNVFLACENAKKKNQFLNSTSEIPSSNDNPDQNLEPIKKFSVALPSEEDLQDQISRGEDPYLVFINQAVERTKSLLTKDPTFYTEIHHVIPRHSGGSDSPENLVRLTYNDHVIAHYIRWFVYRNENDKIAYQVMMGQNIDLRRERARLGGLKGGPKAQAQHKEQGVGWFDSEGQRIRGEKGAAVNREQGTGGFDPKNLQKANQALETAKSQNPEKYADQNRQNLAQGLKTQKEKHINIGDPLSQRRKSLIFHGIKLNGVRYSCNHEDRVYICETTFEYYLREAPKKRE